MERTRFTKMSDPSVWSLSNQLNFNIFKFQENFYILATKLILLHYHNFLSIVILDYCSPMISPGVNTINRYLQRYTNTLAYLNVFQNLPIQAKKLFLHHACQIPVNIWLTIMESLYDQRYHWLLREYKDELLIFLKKTTPA